MKLFKRFLSASVAVAGMVTSMLTFATPAYATTFTVTSTADSGPGSLRQAILSANGNPGADLINFAIPGTGVQTITLASSLDPITDAVTIDGTTQGSSSAPMVELDGTNAGTTGTGIWLAANGSTVRGLIINKFTYQQILVDSSNNVIAGNHLGTNASGLGGLPGGNFSTLRFRTGATGNTVGGSTLTDRNVVYGGNFAISIESGASNNAIKGNSVGVSSDGSILGGGGVLVWNGATGNSILGNAVVTTRSVTPGIDLNGDGVTANDGDGPSPNDPGDADNGANNLQNFPVINYVAVSADGSAAATGVLKTEANKVYQIEFFRNRSVACNASGHGGGETFLGSANATTDLNGNATINVANLGGSNSAVVAGDVITATATDPSGNTSEFSQCVTAAPPSVPGAPRNVRAGAGDAKATVSWSPPASDGGRAITQYDIYLAAGGPSVAMVSAPATSAVVGNLSNGSNYAFVVKAHNTIDYGPASEISDSVTPGPGQPPATSTTQIAGAGQPVATGTAPTSADPTVSDVTAPGGGPVSIAESSASTPSPGSGSSLGQQVDITAPDTTPVNPLVLTFKYDASIVDASKPLRTYRTEGSGPETLVPDCLGSTAARPDGSPCVKSRTRNATTGDWTVKVNTAFASRWRSGQPDGGVIEDVSGIVAYNSWSGVTDASASGGGYRVSSTPNAKATFKTPVTTSITWLTRKGPDQGQANVTIDGVSQGTVTLTSSTVQTNAQVPFSGLSSASHTIVVKVLATSTAAKAVAFDGFVTGATTTQETSTKVRYDNWLSAASSSASAGSYRYCATKSATVSLTFVGTSVSLTTAKGPGYGIAQVFIDGVSQGTIDLYASSQQWQFVQSYLAPSGSGTHLVKIQVTGTKNAASSSTKVVFDALGFS